MYQATVLAIGFGICAILISMIRDARKARIAKRANAAVIENMAKHPLRTINCATKYSNTAIDPSSEMNKQMVRNIRRIQKLYDYRHKMLKWYDEHEAYGMRMADVDKKNRRNWIAYAQNAQENANLVESMTIDAFETWLDRQTAIENLQRAGLVS